MVSQDCNSVGNLPDLPGRESPGPETVWWRKGKTSEVCCVGSGKPGPGAKAANAGMCAGKIMAGGCDRIRTYHQKITARVRCVISDVSARAEAARGLNARRKAHHRSSAFESNATRDSLKLGLMPFEIRPGRDTESPLGGLSGMRRTRLGRARD